MKSTELVRFIMEPSELEDLKWNEKFRYECSCCGDIVETVFQGKSRIKRYTDMLCGKCKSKQTNIERYGVDNPSKSKEIQDKIKATNIERYGVECVFESEEIKEKSRKTMLDRYGVEYSGESKLIVDKAKETCTKKYGKPRVFLFGSEEWNDNMISKYGKKQVYNKEKIKTTNMERYGVEFPISSNKFIAISKMSKLNRYGDENFNNRNLAKDTNLKKYGENYAYSYGSNSFKRLMIERYGVPEYSMTEEYLDKMVKEFGIGHAYSKFIYDGIRFDSTPELALWIYAKDHGEEIEREPETFKFEFEGKTKHVTPDFRYKGKLVEIKGTQFFKDKDTSKEMVNPYDHTKDALYEAKRKCEISNDVEIWSEKEYNEYILYICRMYGSIDFLNQYKIWRFTKDTCLASFCKTDKSYTPFDADHLDDCVGKTPFDVVF